MEKALGVTYEVLYDLMRREKQREDLQDMNPEFFTQVLVYLTEKHKLLESSKHKQDLFSSTEQSETLMQIRNAHRLIKELYERRESKIIAMALSKSRIKNSIVDTSKLLPAEKAFYENLTNTLSQFRQDILLSLLEQRKIQTFRSTDDFKTPEVPKESGIPKGAMVKLLTTVQRFVGPELEEYGPFRESEIASLPYDIAQILIKSGKAQEV